METKAADGSSILLIIVILAMVAATAVVIAPSYDEVKLRPHAIERHGLDAVIARLATRNCTNLKAYRCPATDKHPACYHLICTEATGHLCTVMIVGSKGGELTSLMAGCDRAMQLVRHCTPAVLQ